MIIISSNPIQSVFWLVISFLLGSSVLISIGLDFFPLILIIIYVGAIVILFLFIIMMLELNFMKKNLIFNIIPVLIFFCLNIVLNTQIFIKINKLNYFSLLQIKWMLINENDLTLLGSLIYTFYLVPIIIITTLLLVGLVGTILLGLEISEKRNQHLGIQQRRNNSWT